MATVAFPAGEAADMGGIAAARYAPRLGAMGFNVARALAGGAQAAGTAGLAGLAAPLMAGASPTEALENAGRTGKAFGEGEAAGQLLPPAAGWVWDKLKGIGSGAVQKASQLMSGTRPESFEMLNKNPEAVLAAARKGMAVIPETGKPIPVALQDAQTAARTAQEAIAENSAGAGKKYQAMIDALHEAPENAENFDLGQRVRGGMEDYINKNTPYARANMPSSATGDKKIFLEYLNRARDPAGMAPADAADFLQDITGDIKRAKGAPLSAHLSELKNQVLEAMPGEYKFPEVMDTINPGQTPGVDIKGARDAYAAAKQLERGLKKFGNSNDPLSNISRTLATGGKEAEQLRAAAAHIPEVQAAIDQAAVAKAGADFAPKVGALARTGLTGSAALIAAKAASGNPAMMAEIPLMVTGASPRLTAELLGNYGPAAARAIEGAAGKAAPAIPAALGTARQSMESPTDRDAVSILLAQGGLNPKKSGDAGAGISGIGLPPRLASAGGKMSLDDLTRVWAERGIIPEENPDLTLARLKAIAEKSR